MNDDKSKAIGQLKLAIAGVRLVRGWMGSTRSDLSTLEVLQALDATELLVTAVLHQMKGDRASTPQEVAG